MSQVESPRSGAGGGAAVRGKVLPEGQVRRCCPRRYGGSAEGQAWFLHEGREEREDGVCFLRALSTPTVPHRLPRTRSPPQIDREACCNIRACPRGGPGRSYCGWSIAGSANVFSMCLVRGCSSSGWCR